MLAERKVVFNPLDLYESGMDRIRERFSRESVLATQLLYPGIDPTVLELFLMHFSALGVAMTEPVEGWIRRAGERCEEMGLKELGTALRSHARQEAGHHLMMIEDTRMLVNRWNEQHTLKLDADRILAQPITEGVRRYRELHEQIIAGESPYRQIAVEYEIERMSADYGKKWIEHCVRVLGEDIFDGLSFVREHAEIDIGHTKFNKLQLRKLLNNNPQYAGELVSAGEAALDAYDFFLGDCLQMARAHLNRPT